MKKSTVVSKKVRRNLNVNVMAVKYHQLYTAKVFKDLQKVTLQFQFLFTVVL